MPGEYLLVNDIHLSDRAPSSCTDTYQDDLFDLLDTVGDLAAEREAAAIVLAGDVFHYKTPSRTTHRTVKRFIDVLRSWDCPTLIVPGNHDMTNDRLDSLDDTQPLGVVFASGAAHLLHGWSAVDADLIQDAVYGVPWLMRFDNDTVFDALADWRSRLERRPGNYGLVVAHAPLYPPGKELPYEFYPAGNWAACMDNHGTAHYGHVHEPHGIYHSYDVQFSNPGALSRGSLHEHNLTRAVQIAAWNPVTGTIEHLTLPHKPAAEVFRLTEVAETTAGQARLDTFLESVGQTRIEITSIEAVMAHIRSLQLGPDLENVVADLLTEGANR